MIKYLHAKYKQEEFCDRHPKQRKFKCDWMRSLCLGCPGTQLSLQGRGFCTM